MPPDATPPPPPGRRRRLLPRLVLLATSLALSLLLAEGALRLARPQEVMTVSRGLYEPDPPRRYRLHPGHRGRISNHVEFDHPVVVNRFGLRGGDATAAPASEPAGATAGVRRILALGDSFTFGVGAAEDETYPARLQAHLRAAGLPSVVWNAGTPGFGVPDAVWWYQRWAAEPPLAPDLVVVAAFLANDLRDAAPSSPVRVVDGELVVEGERSGGLRRRLYYHSHLFRLLKASLLEGPLRQRLGLAEPWARRERRAELELYGATLPAELAAGAAATDDAVAQLAELASQRGAQVLAVLVPSLPQVDPRRWQAVHAELGVDPRGHDPRRPNRLFRQIVERHGIAVLDPTEALAAAVARGEPIYYPRDQHLTPAGYDLLARQVAAAVVEGVPAPSGAGRACTTCGKRSGV
jgi:lysophospholipase L1-like esterase